MAPTARVVVVGAGISGLACARELVAAGVDVTVLDRGRRPGGRMASREVSLDGLAHVVDVGASYLTVSDADFAEVVESWRARGLAREWTDTFAVLDGRGRATKGGPVRWAAPNGLRSLVLDLADGLDVRSEHEVGEVGFAGAGAGGAEVDGETADAVVLAMPDPQARDLLPAAVADELGLESEGNAVLSVWAAWPRRWWPFRSGAFVTDSVVLSWIADDGERRGDDAPVLVLHSTPMFAARHLDDPEAAVPGLIGELGAVLGRPVPAPEHAGVQRWSLASPLALHAETFGLVSGPDGGAIGVCGDAWGPRARVEQAWLSGRDLGRELAARLRG